MKGWNIETGMRNFRFHNVNMIKHVMKMKATIGVSNIPQSNVPAVGKRQCMNLRQPAKAIKAEMINQAR